MVLLDGSKNNEVGEIDATIEYDRMEQGVAIPKRILARHTMPGLLTTEDFVFNDTNHVGTNENEFTLSFYGLPEADPRKFGRLRGGIPNWLIAINVIIFLAVVVVGWLRRRYRAKSRRALP